jgi:hypothetical protein
VDEASPGVTGETVVLDWKGDPMILRPGDNIPRGMKY